MGDVTRPQLVTVAGRELRVSNLDEPLYPDGTTKAEVIEYLLRWPRRCCRA